MFVSKRQVKEMVLYSPQHIARLEAAGKFPKRVKLGNNRVGWVEAEVLENIPLYEAPFEPAPIQFYTIKKVNFETRKGMEFNRELRRVGVNYEFNKKKLMLE